MWKICILYLHHHFLLLFNSVPSFCPVLFCSLLCLVTGHFPFPSGTRPSPTLCCPPPLCTGFFTSLVLLVHAVHLHLRPSAGSTKGCWRRGWLQSRGIAWLQGKGPSLFVSSSLSVILKLKTNKKKPTLLIGFAFPITLHYRLLPVTSRACSPRSPQLSCTLLNYAHTCWGQTNTERKERRQGER